MCELLRRAVLAGINSEANWLRCNTMTRVLLVTEERVMQCAVM